MRRRYFFILAVVIVILGMVAMVLGVRAAFRRVREAVSTPHEQTIDLAALVTHVRELNRLETVSMQVIHVGTIKQSYRLVPDAIGGDQITLLAAGEVIGGVDLSRLQDSDVTHEGDGTIVMRLPPAQILMTRVDNAGTRVVSRDTGMLRRADPGLETRARQHAEEMIRAEAFHRGIVKIAADNAEKKLADFLHTAGFRKVRFIRGPGLLAPSPMAR